MGKFFFSRCRKVSFIEMVIKILFFFDPGIICLVYIIVYDKFILSGNYEINNNFGSVNLSNNLFHREIFYYIFLSFFLPFFFFFEGGNRIEYISIKKYIYSRNRREKIRGIKFFSDEVFKFSNFRHHRVGIYLVSSPAIRPDRCRNRVRGMHTHKRGAKPTAR